MLRAWRDERETEVDLVTFGDGRVADVKVTRAGREIIIDHGAACRVRCEVRCSDVGSAGNQYRPEAPADRPTAAAVPFRTITLLATVPSEITLRSGQPACRLLVNRYQQ